MLRDRNCLRRDYVRPEPTCLKPERKHMTKVYAQFQTTLRSPKKKYISGYSTACEARVDAVDGKSVDEALLEAVRDGLAFVREHDLSFDCITVLLLPI
jgi:hypothetical protein